MCLLLQPAPAADLAEKGMALMKTESLDGIRLEMPQSEVLKALGKPAKKGQDIEWEAIGEFVQEWRFPDHGLVLNMTSIKKGAAKTVFSVALIPPGKQGTKKGIHLGSTEAEVGKAYGALRDPDSSEKGKTFVVGSLYGGLVFTFEKGKVVGIFLGASAE
ncbi:MAG: hypothetical protein ACAI34_02530 [Verrucomicrobium sp.]|nr:hypothetical protein [Verrucomicrobium sp.]